MVSTQLECFLKKAFRIGALIAACYIFSGFIFTEKCYAQSGDQPYAVLIVGDEGDADMLRIEKILINEMAKQVRADSASERLPIFSYHFNKERERAYCENKLNVLSEDLLFVGVVTLDNKVPQKVIYRIDRIVNAPRAAKDVLDRADELAFGDDKVASKETPLATVAKPKTSSDSSAISSSGPAKVTSDGLDKASQSNVSVASGALTDGYRVQLGSFTSVDYANELKSAAQKAGFTVSVVSAAGTDGDTLYKVLSSVVPERLRVEELLAKFKSAGFSQAFLIRADKK